MEKPGNARFPKWLLIIEKNFQLKIASSNIQIVGNTKNARFQKHMISEERLFSYKSWKKPETLVS